MHHRYQLQGEPSGMFLLRPNLPIFCIILHLYILQAYISQLFELCCFVLFAEDVHTIRFFASLHYYF
jgi:hypothetical protein